MTAAGESRVQGIIDRIVREGDEIMPEVFDQIEAAVINGYDLTVDDEEKEALTKLESAKLLGDNQALHIRLAALRLSDNAGDYMRRLQESFTHCQAAQPFPEDEVTERDCIHTEPSDALFESLRERMEGVLSGADAFIVEALRRTWPHDHISDHLSVETYQPKNLSFHVDFPLENINSGIIRVVLSYQEGGSLRGADLYFQYDKSGGITPIQNPFAITRPDSLSPD
ncbi:MAG: hypothetical protein HY465_02230 [Deltaproteobacteria bacterium]|nr:hypothetical protein [Deltaproteobacteria bacterium]